MAEYSRLAKGHITTLTGGGTPVINLPFQPTSVKWWNFTASTSGGATGYVTNGYWDVSMGQGAAIYDKVTASTLALVADTTATGGVSSFAAGMLLQYGPAQTIGASGSITAGTPTDVVTTSAHGLVSGNWIVFTNLYETTTTGMQQIAGMPFQVTVTSTTAFNVNWDTSGSGFTTITGGDSALAAAAGFKQILYPCLYEPGVSFIDAINTSTGVVTTTAPHNFQVGQEIGFHIPKVYGSVQLNELPDILIPGSPVYYYVSAVGSSTTFTVANFPSGVSAFVPNQPFASFPGLKFPTVVAVGDINSGGTPYSGGALYPSPLLYNGQGLGQSPTINGPAISGAYVNNTSQGFFIGSTAAPTASQVIYWEAMLHDLSVN